MMIGGFGLFRQRRSPSPPCGRRRLATIKGQENGASARPLLLRLDSAQARLAASAILAGA
jgi:hypothetical protein